MFAHRLALLVPLALLLSGCPSTPTGNDAGDTDVIANTDVPVVDVPSDTGVVDSGTSDTGPTPVLFGTCTSDAGCPTGGTCLTEQEGYPGGFCTQSCASDDECPSPGPGQMGVCLAVPGHTGKMCLRYCVNGADCGRDGYTCVELNHTFMINACAPSCTDASCVNGTRCNAWTSQCEATSVPYPPAGADDGQPCASDSACRGGHCVLPVNARNTPTGYNNGYCTSNCALTAGWNPSTVYSGTSLPQANCPAHAICLPNGSNEAQFDPGICLAECTMDSDCRASEGYYCRRSFTLANMRVKTFANGFCVPVDCLNDTNHPCPTGYACQTLTASDGTRSGVCKSAPVTDAGGPDVVDASPADTGTPDSGDDAGTIDDIVGVDVDLGDASLPDVLGQ